MKSPAKNAATGHRLDKEPRRRERGSRTGRERRRCDDARFYPGHGPSGDASLLGWEKGYLVAYRREVEALRPWGRALAPMVTILFSHGGVEYRLTKRFLDRPSSDLARQEGGRFVRLAEGDAADDRAREILKNLEKGEYTEAGTPRLATGKRGAEAKPSPQLSLFTDGDDLLRQRLRGVNIAMLTPLEALNLLDELKRMV